MSNFDRAVKALNDVDEAIDHLADNEAYAIALEAAGLLMPDLPEPEPTYSGTQWVTTHSTTMLKGTEEEYETGTVVLLNNSSKDVRPPVAIGFGIGLDFMTADETRSVALALLAAADYADSKKGSSNVRHG